MHHGWLPLNTTADEACVRTQTLGLNIYEKIETAAEAWHYDQRQGARNRQCQE